jgi:tRNA(fMet)-specific endonuclease VapC
MILDTNAVSALAAKDRAIAEVIADGPSLCLPFIAYAEFRYGLLGSDRPDPGFRLLADLLAHFPLLLPDPATLDEYADIKDQLKRIGRKIPDNDIWIAALARQHALPVLSRDHHFDHVPGLQRLEW